MTTLVRIQLECPVCGTVFASQRIASTNSVGQDTDFRPQTLGIDPQPHYVHVCPNCMFAAFEGDYGSVPQPVRELVESGGHCPHEFLPELLEGELSGSAKYLLAARCYSRDPRATDLRLADLHLRASWCARQEGRPEREHAAQCEALLLFEKALETGEVATDQRKTILYLVGELYRRVGRHELAVAMFDRAYEAADDGDPDPRFLVLIRRQRSAAVAGLSDNMHIEPE